MDAEGLFSFLFVLQLLGYDGQEKEGLGKGNGNTMRPTISGRRSICPTKHIRKPNVYSDSEPDDPSISFTTDMNGAAGHGVALDILETDIRLPFLSPVCPLSEER